MDDFTDANGLVRKRNEIKCGMCGKPVSVDGLKQHILAVHGGVYDTRKTSAMTPSAPVVTEEMVNAGYDKYAVRPRTEE